MKDRIRLRFNDGTYRNVYRVIHKRSPIAGGYYYIEYLCRRIVVDYELRQSVALLDKDINLNSITSQLRSTGGYDYTLKLNLNQFSHGRFISSRSVGKEAYLCLGMNSIIRDIDNRICYKIVLDKDVITIGSGFFLELFAKVIKTLGSEEKFLRKFDFSDIHKCVKDEVIRYIELCLE